MLSEEDKHQKKNKKIEEIIERLEAKPYTAYTLYGDILYESDEIVQMLQSLLEDNKEEIEETNLRYLICESDFKNMNIVKLLNEFFEENNLIVNKLVRAVNKIGRNKQC